MLERFKLLQWNKLYFNKLHACYIHLMWSLLVTKIQKGIMQFSILSSWNHKLNFEKYIFKINELVLKAR